MEGPAEDISVDRRRCSEHRVRDGYNSRVLAAEAGKRQRRGVSKVELEVDQTDWENEHISFVQNLCEEAVRSVCLVGRHETNQELSLDDDKDFRAAGVSVRRVLAVWGVVNANQLYAESVQAGDSVNVHGGHIGADFVVSVSWLVEAGKEEVVSFGKLWILAESPIDEHCSSEKKKKIP